jgi:hypothetical protein
VSSAVHHRAESEGRQLDASLPLLHILLHHHLHVRAACVSRLRIHWWWLHALAGEELDRALKKVPVHVK